MDPLAEARVVDLLLARPEGWVFVFGDASCRWSDKPVNPRLFWHPGDVPEAIPCRRYTYQQARLAFAHAVKRLRYRGVKVG